ncbi:MAG: hypothetical protein AB7J35_05370 [Dehalococcoidia bacterium]
MNEPEVRDEERHHATDGSESSTRPPDVDEMRQLDTAPPGERLSRKQVLVVVLIALLVAGAVVAHLLTGPGVSH